MCGMTGIAQAKGPATAGFCVTLSLYQAGPQEGQRHRVSR